MVFHLNYSFKVKEFIEAVWVFLSKPGYDKKLSSWKCQPDFGIILVWRLKYLIGCNEIQTHKLLLTRQEIKATM